MPISSSKTKSKNSHAKRLSKKRPFWKRPTLWLLLGVFIIAGGFVLTQTHAATWPPPKDNYGCPSNVAARPTLVWGNTGPCVKRLQVDLNASPSYALSPGCLGANLAVDGIFGTGTHSAVLLFQAKEHLTQDGIVGQNTWRALQAGGCEYAFPN